MNVSIILVHHNGYELTRNALLSIQQHSPSSEVIVVDNGSNDGSIASLKKTFSSTMFIELGENKGFGFANNVGARSSKGKYVFFLNNDTVLQTDTPSILSAVLEERQDVAAVGPMLVNPDGSLQCSFGYEPSIWNERKTRRLQRLSKSNPAQFRNEVRDVLELPTALDWVTGAALMVRRSAFEALGGFDESFFMYFEDADLCSRIRQQGGIVLYEPASAVVHIGGATVAAQSARIKIEYRKSQLRYYSLHCSLLSQAALRMYLFFVFGARSILSSLRFGSEDITATAIMKLALKQVR